MPFARRSMTTRRRLGDRADRAGRGAPTPLQACRPHPTGSRPRPLDGGAGANRAAVAAKASRCPAGDWHDILAALKLSGMARELAQHCELRDLGGRMVLRLSPTHRHLLMKTGAGQAAAVAAEHFGRPLQLAIELEEGSGDTPAAAGAARPPRAQDRAIASVEQDGFVRDIIETFDAT
jgi:DNA polymerase-3 subunit gamma/tau